MAHAAEERLVEWLRDAHAMEEQAQHILATTASRLENHPELRQQLERDRERSHRQAAMLKQCIAKHGTDTSTLKDIAAKVLAVAQGLSGVFVGDEVVKAALALYTFKHMEIASYKILIAAAERVGDFETKRACEQALQQEREMVDWFEQTVPAITLRYLDREEAGAATKH
jgi:ferritin-like metal-binding protein YciE